MTATVGCWLVGALLLWVATSRQRFEQMFGKALESQYRRLPDRSMKGANYPTFIESMRRFMLGLGGLLLLLAVISTAAMIRG
jgi:hypothetical protein